MQTLTREQAIQRIRDIMAGGLADSHIYKVGYTNDDISMQYRGFAYFGAINELRAIFDIKEEEL